MYKILYALLSFILLSITQPLFCSDIFFLDTNNAYSSLSSAKPIAKITEFVDTGLNIFKINLKSSNDTFFYYVFSFDQEFFDFDIKFNKDFSLNYISDFFDSSSVFAVNASYFKTVAPLGLLLKNSKIYNKIQSNLSGFLLKQNNKFSIYYKIKNINKFTDGIQSFPTLLVNKKIPEVIKKYKNFYSVREQRTAVSQTKDKNRIDFIIGSHMNAKLTFYELALILKKLNYTNALALDGGTSSQCYFKKNSKEIFIPNLNRIMVSMVCFPKE